MFNFKIGGDYITDYVGIEDVDLSDPFYSLEDLLLYAGAFDKDSIGYYQSMEYLMQYDSSLKESVKLAVDLGYSLENVTSEFLASLLMSQHAKEDFYKLKDKIEAYFESIEEEE